MSDTARLVVIIGSVAVGKSTIAHALAHTLRADGELVAVVGLDDVADMAQPTLPSWDWASRVHAATVRAWLQAPMTTVIAEGPGTVSEVEHLLSAVTPAVIGCVVVLDSDYDTSLRRARADHTRGVSANPEFLRRMHTQFTNERHHFRPDLTLDTARTSIADAVHLIVDYLHHNAQASPPS